MRRKSEEQDRGSFLEYIAETLWKIIKKLSELLIKIIKKILKWIWTG